MADSGQSSGRSVLRISSGLHGALRAAADEAGLSLNEYCARKLAAPGGAVDPDAAAAVEAAAEIAGERLVGIVLFGSWARGEAGPDSDVDLLIVLEEGSRISRQLYRPWDAEPRTWHGHALEPHFVAMPGEPRPLPGVWAEAAIDGIVLFERSFRISRTLARVRADIAAGRIRRRHTHGQPYWVETA